MNIVNRLAAYLIFIAGVTACTDWDDFKKYQQGGEIVYPGRGDTVLIASGRDRMQLKWLLSGDPSVSKFKLFWNNKADSLEGMVPADLIGDTLGVMIDPLPEGSYNFEMFSLDAKGNKSVPLRFNGRTFGATYESGLLNRSIGSAAYDDSLKVLEVLWNEPDTVNIATELRYIGTDSKTKSVTVAPEATSSQIKDWKPGSILSYRSTFKPNRKAIDAFTAPKFDTLSVRLK